jgi:hypothetical protein
MRDPCANWWWRANWIFLPPADDDEEAIAHLTRIKGIGRWSAEIYLLFAEGRPDIWPAGDLAVQVGLQAAGLPERPSEKATREMAEIWRPHAARRRSSPGIAIITRPCSPPRLASRALLPIAAGMQAALSASQLCRRGDRWLFHALDLRLEARRCIWWGRTALAKAR